MKEDWLDKGLGDKLDGYDSPMNLENAWEAFQTKREEPKKKRRFFFFWIFSGVFLLGTLSGYIFYKNGNSNSEIIPATEISNKDILQPTIQQKDFSIAKNEKNDFTKTERPGLITENTTREINALKNANSKIKTIPQQQNQLDEETYLKSNFINDNISLGENQPMENSADFSQKKSVPTNSTTDELKINAAANAIPALAYLPSLKTNLLEISSERIFEPKVHLATKDFPKKKKFAVASIPVPNYLNVSIGYGIHSKGKVFEDEKLLDVLSVNIHFEKRFDKTNFYLKSGINFDQMINSLERTSELTYTQNSSNELILINYYQNGNVDEIYGEAEVTAIEKITSKEFNRYRLISIPVIVGYDIFSNKKMSLQIEGGGARSILGFHSGKSFDLADLDFEKQRIWQGLYGVNFNYNFNRNVQLFSSVRGNHHFNKIGKSDNLNIEKFRLYQAQLGLRFKL